MNHDNGSAMGNTYSKSDIDVAQDHKCLCMVGDESDQTLIAEVCNNIGSRINFLATSKTCLDALSQVRCHLIILDYKILGLTCVDLLRQINSITPSASVIVLADIRDFYQAFQAMKLEASYICLKPLDKEKFQEIVRSNLTISLKHENIQKEVISKTEAQILHLVLNGYSSSEISHELHRSVRTIEGHRYHIMKKLGAENSIDLVKKAYRWGFHDFLED